ncbi:Ig-like domain-containing protein [Tahibacter soli]|uniref:Ig-like domain-containing protein n=1 Tax=Tahibacter soli TaxID=2983605 RepID=A0A9X3YK85_9GAMM|nr:Ig-like domain-containing protein [Tahibacter soli]MDC8013822.1 Ig-like domain-containing protein [Tahibacter soli]
MHRSLLALSIALALSAPVAAQDNATPEERRPAVDPSVPLTYVGPNARVSLGVNQDGDVGGEGLGVFGFDGDSAWIAQFWLAEHGAGGVQLDYHFLWGGKTRQDTIDNPDSVRVGKAFVAVDQNVWHDRKATLGMGYEKDDFFVDGYVSGGITGSRFVSSAASTVTDILTGVENGRQYTQTSTTRTVVDAFERPYEAGVGVRVGKHFEDSLWRVRGGLDYERGRYNSDQFTLSAGVDKYFRNSGWSLSLEGEHVRKKGDFEIDRNDDRGWLFVRYDFGDTFRPKQPYREVQVERTEAVAAAPAEMQVVRNEVKLDGDAFFDFDRSTLRPDAVAALTELIAKANGTKRVSRIRIVGHTDSVGTDAYNQRLSERRAKAAADYLISQGVSAAEIDTAGDGERNPAYPNDTRANRQKNRRVDVEFLTIEETAAPVAPEPKKIVEWKREPVPAPAAWIERALRNPAQHKRTVDVYRFEKSSSTTTLGPRVFANRPPDARDDTATVPRNAAATPIAVLANDVDPDGDPLTITATGAPAHGTATIAGGVVNYTPVTGYVGTDTFTYTIADGMGGTDTATVTITIGADGNRPPVAQDDTASTQPATPVTIAVLSNDSDPDGDTLSVASVGTPANGTAALGANGAVTYTPAAGFTGTDTFTYTVSDGKGGTATARVTVTIGAAGNRAPIAVDDTANVLKGGGADINVLANDTDPDGDRLRVVSVENLGPHQATVTINPDGTIRFEHVHGTEGAGRLRYTITDDHGHEATAIVVVFVTNVPNP